MKHNIMVIGLLFMLVLAVIAAGCTTQTTTHPTSHPILYTATPTTLPPTPETLWDETVYVDDGYEKEYSFDITDPPVTLKVSINTDDSPVDLLVLDKDNYKIFDKGFTSGNKCSFKTIGSEHSIIKTTKTYTLLKKDRYYVVIENADFLTNGAHAGHGVRCSIKVTVS
jgi:hypothetical protein